MTFTSSWRIIAIGLGIGVLLAALDAKAQTLLNIGDSITARERSYVEEQEGWTTLNIAQGGTTARDWLTPGIGEYPAIYGAGYLLDWVAGPVDVVHVQLGSNDATGFFDTRDLHPFAFGWNLRELLHELMRRWPEAVLLVSTPPRIPTGDEALRRKIDGFCEIIHAVVTSMGPRVKLGLDLRTVPLHLIPDGLHPSEEAHERLRYDFARRLRRF